jgi:PAS domain-containing protein
MASYGPLQEGTSRIRQLSSTISSLQRGDGGGLADTLYRAIVDTAVDAIIVIDRNGAIRSVNQATEQLFGGRADRTQRQDPDAGALCRRA